MPPHRAQSSVRVNATLRHPLFTSCVFLSVHVWDHRAYGAVRRVHSFFPRCGASCTFILSLQRHGRKKTSSIPRPCTPARTPTRAVRRGEKQITDTRVARAERAFFLSLTVSLSLFLYLLLVALNTLKSDLSPTRSSNSLVTHDSRVYTNSHSVRRGRARRSTR